MGHYRTENAFKGANKAEYAAAITTENEGPLRAWLDFQSSENATALRIAGLEPSHDLYMAALHHFGRKLVLPD